MSTQTVTVRLPKPLYQRIQNAAQIQRRPIEKLLLDSVATGMSLLDDLPPELASEMAALALLNDAALWRTTRSTLSTKQQKQMSKLLQAKQRGKLPPEDQPVLDQLLAEYERAVLIRAQAVVLLRQRGYDVSDPSILNEPNNR